MDDLEDPNVTARAEMLRSVRERLKLGARGDRPRKRMSLLMRLVAGVAGALFVGMWQFVVPFPAFSVMSPYFWWIVGIAFIIGFLFGHLAPSGNDDV